MKNYILTYLLMFLSIALFGQSSDTWLAFRSKDSTLIGFKDKNGVVKIKPQFMPLTIASKFDNIIAVSEEVDGVSSSYYLTKTGRIVGKSNLYMLDNGPDCESEGFIRFRDKKTHMVGMFNGRGDRVITTGYNFLTPVRNGMIVGLKGAHWDKSKISEHNEFPWVGGKVVLIDTNNKILAEDFTFDSEIDFFSSHIASVPDRNPIRENFKAVDGKYYSFINFDKEFARWLKSYLLVNFSKNKLLAASSKKITFWKRPGGWTNEDKLVFINKNFDLLKSKLLELTSAKCEYHIFSEGLNPYIFSSSEYEQYFDNCGQSKDWIYPEKNIVITHRDNKNISQDQFEFLRTDNGYKLISVSFKQETIK